MHLFMLTLAACIDTPVSCSTKYYPDVDEDDYAPPSAAAATGCDLKTANGWTTHRGDCAPDDPSIHPGAEEICDGVDQDCDGAVDDGLATHASYQDADGDGHGNAAASYDGCDTPDGYVDSSDDCNDSDASVYPGADDPPGDGIDEGCDGSGSFGGDIDIDKIDWSELLGEMATARFGKVVPASPSMLFFLRADGVTIGSYVSDFTGSHYTSESTGNYGAGELVTGIVAVGDLAPIGSTGDGLDDVAAIGGSALVEILQGADVASIDLDGTPVQWAQALDGFLVAGTSTTGMYFVDPRVPGDTHAFGFSKNDIFCADWASATLGLTADVTGDATDPTASAMGDLVTLGVDSTISAYDGAVLAGGARCSQGADTPLAATLKSALPVNDVVPVSDLDGDGKDDLVVIRGDEALLVTGPLSGYELDLDERAAAVVTASGRIAGAFTWHATATQAYVAFLLPDEGRVAFVDPSNLVGGGALESTALVSFTFTSTAAGFATWGTAADIDGDGLEDVLLGDDEWDDQRGHVLVINNVDTW